MFQLKSPDFKGKFEALRNELKQAGVVTEVAESSSPLTGVWSNNGGFNWDGKDPALQTDFATIWVTHEYGKTINWNVVEGRDFSREFSTDTSALVINQAAVKFMDLKDPIGKVIRWGDDKDARQYTIIGVVSDILASSPFENIKQAFYFNTMDEGNWLVFRLAPSLSTSESLAGIEKILKRQFPAVPFDYKFVDADHARKFASEERIGKLSGIFAMLAVFISCLGLLGLASFMAAQRTKEIGIRKVLGASTTSLWGMLSKDFVILVIISCFIAIPISYYYTSNWLKGYEYKTELSWWIFVGASAGALLITLLTVSFQAIKAALGNPANALRSE
jgi:ABC-type antimicrobial peptide transport system permease subunit